jgi:membrane protease subunit (stomatin/prohibitin family)
MDYNSYDFSKRIVIMAIISVELVSITYIQIVFNVFSHRRTGAVIGALGIYAFISLLSGAAIVSLLSSVGSMAAGLCFLFYAGSWFGDVWNKFWTTVFDI